MIGLEDELVLAVDEEEVVKGVDDEPDVDDDDERIKGLDEGDNGEPEQAPQEWTAGRHTTMGQQCQMQGNYHQWVRV